MTNKPISYWMGKEEMSNYYKGSSPDERVKIRSAINRLTEVVEGVEFDEGMRLKKFKKLELEPNKDV